MRKSKIPNAGRGIFADKNYEENRIIHNCPFIYEKMDNIKGKLLNYYRDEKEIEVKNAIIPFGLCPIFNHSSKPNVSYEFGNMDTLNVRTNRKISSGEEIRK